MGDLVRIDRNNNPFSNITLEDNFPLVDLLPNTATTSQAPNNHSLKPFIKWGIVAIIVIISILIILKLRK